MENHLLLAFFLLFVVGVIIEMIRLGRFSVMGMLFIFFAILFSSNKIFSWSDSYMLWTFAFGAGIGLILCSSQIFKSAGEQIKKKLQWKLPLLIALGANALGRFAGENWVWTLVIIVTLLLLPQKRIWWIVTMIASVLNLIVSIWCNPAFVIVLPITLYSLFKLSSASSK